jgi:hypothetical protein
MREPEDDLARRLRECLEPDQASIERLKASVLSVRASHRRLTAVVTLSACTTLLVALVALWSWRSVASPVNEFKATFEGDVLIIRAADGTGSILGPPSATQPPAGTGQVTFEGERQ